MEYDVDARLPAESQVQLEVRALCLKGCVCSSGQAAIMTACVLQVTPITIVGSEPYFEIQPRIAVNDAYICYALKQGHIRALHQSTGRRALLKGASAPPGIR